MGFDLKSTNLVENNFPRRGRESAALEHVRVGTYHVLIRYVGSSITMSIKFCVSV